MSKPTKTKQNSSMAKFTDLASEILQRIWRLVPVDDTMNFAAVCTTIRGAGEHYRKKHIERRKKYSVIRTTTDSEKALSQFFVEESQYEFLPPPSLLSVLSSVSKEPILAEYVREAHIGSCLSSWGSGLTSKREYWTKSLGMVLAIAMHKCAYLDCHASGTSTGISDEAARCIRSIDSGNEDVIIGLLLALLPKIRTLRFRITQLLPEFCVRVIDRIARHPTATALSHLTTVKIDFNHGCFTAERPLAMLAVCAALPSLKTLCATNMGRVSQRPSENRTPTRSNVTKLALKKISIDSACLCLFLDMFRALKKFTYESFVPRKSAAWNPAPTLFDSPDIINLLLHYAEKSLTHLKLHARCNGGAWMGTLDAFTSLTHIHTDWRLLLDGTNASDQQLVDNLPSTLQQLYLKVGPHFDVETNATLIENLVLAKKSRFPVLRDIRLVHISCDQSVILLRKAFIRAAANVGVVISCDTAADPDFAEVVMNNTREVDFPSLKEHLTSLLEGDE